MSDASGGTLKQPPMKSKKASTLWAASQQSTSTHQNLSKKMRQSSSKLTCWGSDKKHFYIFLVSVEFSALFQYVPWTEVGLFSHVCDGHQSINRDLQWFIFTYRKRIPIYSHYGMDDPSYTMFWQKCTLSGESLGLSPRCCSYRRTRDGSDGLVPVAADSRHHFEQHFWAPCLFPQNDFWGRTGLIVGAWQLWV